MIDWEEHLALQRAARKNELPPAEGSQFSAAMNAKRQEKLENDPATKAALRKEFAKNQVLELATKRRGSGTPRESGEQPDPEPRAVASGAERPRRHSGINPSLGPFRVGPTGRPVQGVSGPVSGDDGAPDVRAGSRDNKRTGARGRKGKAARKRGD